MVQVRRGDVPARGPVELQGDLAVVVGKHPLLAGCAAAVQKHLATDEVVVGIVAVLNPVELLIGRVLGGDLYQPVAVVPSVIRVGVVTDLGAFGDVAFIIVRVIVRAVGGEPVVRAGGEAAVVAIAVVVVGVRLIVGCRQPAPVNWPRLS